MNESGIDMDFDIDFCYDTFLKDACSILEGSSDQNPFYELKSKTVDPSDLGT